MVRPGRTRPVGGVDVSLYHIGNNPDAHGWIVDALRRQPGVVVLHDWVIHHLVAGLTIGRKDGHAYLAAMEREAGVPGRLLGYGVLEGRVPPLWEVRPEEFPLAGEVLDRSTGLIVHSHYVEERARDFGYDGPLWRIPHPAWPAPSVEPAAVEGAPLIGCFGHINESKRIPQLLRAFAELRRTHPGARLLLVGSEAPGFDLAGRLERTGLDAEGVIREPYVEEQRLWSLMAACDACVLLRAPTMGETSGSAIRTLSLGKPVVVSDVGWFAELPDDVALKVPVGGDEEIAALTAALERLADPETAARMGAAARAYVEREHDLDHVAGLYAAALEEAAGDSAVRERVLREVAEAAAVAGVEPELLAPELQQAALVSPDGHGPGGHVPGSDTGSGPRGTGLLRSWPMWLWVGALYAVSVAVQLALGLRVVSPWIMVDELVYSDMARSFAATGHFLIRGVHGNYGFVYPLLLSPAYALFGSMHDVYQWARVVDALVMSSAVFPAYLLARRVVRPSYALAAAALAVAIPSMAYVGTLMTENAFYPIFLWLVFALLLMLDRPTLGRQLAVLGLCVLAFVTRAQTVALVAGGADGAARARVDRARPAAAARRLQGAVRHRRRRGRSRRRRRARARPLAVAHPRQLLEDLERRLPLLAGAEVARPASRRARPLRVGRALRRADRPRRERTASRPPAARLRRGDGVAVRVARARGRGLRVALLAPHRGAEPLLSRAAAARGAARLDRAGTAAAAARCRRRRRHRGRASRARSRSCTCSTSRRSPTRSASSRGGTSAARGPDWRASPSSW